MTIPRIRNINTIETYQIPDVANVYIPRWMTTQPNVDYLLPPVVINIGNPIVDIPGCVKAHKDNKKHKTGIPIDKDLVENDEGNAMTLCPDGSYPHYDAMNYEPEQLLMTYEQKPPVVPPPPVSPVSIGSVSSDSLSPKLGGRGAVSNLFKAPMAKGFSSLDNKSYSLFDIRTLKLFSSLPKYIISND